MPCPWRANYFLRPLERQDAAALFDIFADPAVVEHMDIDVCENIEAATEVVEWTRAIRDSGTGIRWGIFPRGRHNLVGTCGYNRFVLDRSARGELAYDLARRWWGSGIMREVLPAVIAYGFHRKKLRRIEAFVTPENERSCRLLERHGFECEARLRDYAYWKNRFWDQLLYARIADPQGR